MSDDEVGLPDDMLVVARRIVDHGELLRRGLQSGDGELALSMTRQASLGCSGTMPMM